MPNPFKNFLDFFLKVFTNKRHVKIGLYGPTNSGKSTLANRITKDWLGEEMSSVSRIPHETREIITKEKITAEQNGKKLTFNLVDTPGIATKIDYEDFLKYKMSVKEARKGRKKPLKVS